MPLRNRAPQPGDIEVIVSADLDVARRHVLERLAVAAAPVARFQPGDVAIAGGAEWYTPTMDPFDNLHREVRVSCMSSFRRRDPLTDSLLERFALDLEALDARSTATRDVISLVAALRTRRRRLGVVFPLTRLSARHEQAFMQVARERSGNGQSTIVISDYGSLAYQLADVLTVLRSGILEYRGPVDGVADLRVRLASSTNPLAAERLLREQIRVVASRVNSVTRLAESAADLVASIVGERTFALALNGEFPALTPLVAVRNARSDQDESTLRAAAMAVLTTHEPIASGRFSTTSLGTTGAAGSWLLIERTNDLDSSIPLTGLAEIEDGRRDIVRRQIEDHRSRAIIRNDAIGALVGGIAHDLNNSLQSILGLIDLLEDSHQSDVDGERIRTMRLVAGDSSAFVHRLLALTRAGDIDVEAVDLDLIIRDAVQLVQRGSVGAARFDVRRTATNTRVNGNQSELRSVFLNLFLNSIQACKPGGHIQVTMVDGDGPDTVTVRVIDNGHGIDDAIIPKIFEPFVSGQEGAMSMGLGLAVAHSVLAEFGAEIRVEATSPMGTTMRIDFPLLSTGAATRVADTPSDGVALPGGAGVLICDDNPHVLEVLGELTSSLGFAATTVANGSECIEAYQADPASFAVVIVDQMMPEISGDEVIARLAAINPEIRTIWLSGYRPKDAALAADLGAGATVKLTKPVTRSQLADALRAALADLPIG